MEMGVEAQTVHNGFAVRDRESREYIFTVTSEMSANLNISPELALYKHFSGGRKV